MTVFILNRGELRMQFNGARLMGERSQGIGLQMWDNRETTELTSGIRTCSSTGSSPQGRSPDRRANHRSTDDPAAFGRFGPAESP